MEKAIKTSSSDEQPLNGPRFLRYPGGKTKLLGFLSEFLPKKQEIRGRYVEPFVGGGSVFLSIRPLRAILADKNRELIDLYKGIRYYPHRLWEAFCDFPYGKKAYYRIRNVDLASMPLYYRAARTLYLNRTCFKGMWRHSISGNFNVGYGGEARRWAITHDNIVELSNLLRKAEIITSDFEDTIERARNGDFFFLDPPYKPGHDELKEAHYLHGRFTMDEQIRLCDSLKLAFLKYDIRWAMTNSDHPDIRALYRGCKIIKIPRGTGNRIGIFSEIGKEILILNP